MSGMPRFDHESLAILQRQVTTNNEHSVDLKAFFYDTDSADYSILKKYFKSVEINTIQKKDFNDIIVEKKAKESSINNVLSMYYSRFLALKDLENRDLDNFYDLSVYTRSDVFLSSRINYSKIIQNNIENKIYIPSGGDYRGINDKFCVCGLKIMKIYLGVYSEIFNYVDAGIEFHPETLQYHHLKKMNVDIVRLSLNDFIFRGNDDILYGDYAVRKKYDGEI